MADKAAAIYVPVVHTVALLTFAGGWALGLGPREALIRAVNERLRVPTDCAELALLTAREHTHVHASEALGATALMRLLERCDAVVRVVSSSG